MLALRSRRLLQTSLNRGARQSLRPGQTRRFLRYTVSVPKENSLAKPQSHHVSSGGRCGALRLRSATRHCLGHSTKASLGNECREGYTDRGRTGCPQAGPDGLDQGQAWRGHRVRPGQVRLHLDPLARRQLGDDPGPGPRQDDPQLQEPGPGHGRRRVAAHRASRMSRFRIWPSRTPRETP